LKAFTTKYIIEVHELGKRLLIPNEQAMEAFPLPATPFPFQSKTKYRNRLGSTLVLALSQKNKKYAFVPNERDNHDQRYNELSKV
jgi:hypothetical protein